MGDVSTGDKDYPPRAPPSAENISFAQQLVQDTLKVDIDLHDHGETSSAKGWSDSDIIIVRSTRGQRWIVKLPRELNSNSVRACRQEAQAAQWAGHQGLSPKVAGIDASSGAFIMDLLEDSHALTASQTIDRLPEITTLLRRFHQSPPPTPNTLQPWDFYPYAQESLDEPSTLSAPDRSLIERIIRTAKSITHPITAPLVPCHNDFWGRNILSDRDGKLWAVDFQECGMGDPLWDVAYLGLELETVHPREIAALYGIEDKERLRKVVAYYYAAQAWLAAWSAGMARDAAWARFLPHYLDRVRSIPEPQEW